MDLLIVDVVIIGVPRPGDYPVYGKPGAGMLVVILLVNVLGAGLLFWAFVNSSKSSKKREEKASRQSPVIDTHILEVTIDGLSDDDTREKFIDSIPGFYQSDVVDLQQCLTKEVKLKIHRILVDFFRRTLLSNSIPGLAKFRCLAISITATDYTDISTGSGYNFAEIIPQWWHEMPQSGKFGEFLRSWDKSRSGRYAQWIIANIVAKKDERDDRWMALTMEYLGISEQVLQDYLAHGDSILLAILIHSIHAVNHAIRSNFTSFLLLPPLSGFDVRNTLPGLRHEFCRLWNTLDRRDSSSSMSILKATHYIYVTLHGGTDASPVPSQPSWYPLCNIPDHLPDSTPPVLHTSVGETRHTAISDPPSSSVSDFHSGDATPHPADRSSLGDVMPAQISQSFPPRSAPAPVTQVTTTSTQTLTRQSSISAPVSHEPHSTPAVTGDRGSPPAPPALDSDTVSLI